MNIQVHIVSALIDGDAGGNAAGVVLDADRLTQEQKLSIAAQVGLSETAFVSTSSVADFKLEFFTPSSQIAHCGHATVATFSLLRETGKITSPISSKETIDGIREIHIEGERIFMEQRAPKFSELTTSASGIDVDTVLSSLRLSRSDLLEGMSASIVSTGNPFMMIPVRNEAIVFSAAPQFDAINAVSNALDLCGYYLFSVDAKVPGRDAGTRMFAPRYGIDEESATGMAAGPLACFLHDKLNIRKNVFQIEQGHLMSPVSPSLIDVQLSVAHGQIQKLMAGGKGKVIRSMLAQI